MFLMKFSESSALAPSGYLIVEANGGLNQQRSAVSSSLFS